jgi:hypothetical protein
MFTSTSSISTIQGSRKIINRSLSVACRESLITRRGIISCQPPYPEQQTIKNNNFNNKRYYGSHTLLSPSTVNSFCDDSSKISNYKYNNSCYHRQMSTPAGTSTSTPVLSPPPDGQQLADGPPDKITVDMACKIADTTKFFIQHGISGRRLKNLAKAKDKPILERWQIMMQIFLSTQLHVLTGMGYPASDEGLAKYSVDLMNCIQTTTDETMQELLNDSRRETWRDIVSIAFNVTHDEIPTISIVEARSIMHQITTKMCHDDTITAIFTRASSIVNENKEIEMAQRHHVLQDIIVNYVYLGGVPSIVQQVGFADLNATQAECEAGYAKLQCALTDYEGDPLIGQYVSAAMIKMWSAAGLDLENIETQGTAGPMH